MGVETDMIDFVTDEDRQVYRDYLKEYIDKNCIIRVPPGSQPMLGKAPGTFYTWQFYLRRGLFNPLFNEMVAALFLDLIQKEVGHFDFQIAGLETASTPLLVSIPMVAQRFGIQINAFSVRKNRKEYGLHNWIEGGVIRDLPVLLVDDLCNSSNSMQKAMYTIYGDQKLGFTKFAFSVVNKSHDVFKNCKTMPEDFKMLSLFSLRDFNLSGAGESSLDI
jgi:orotate phosphoribosyltransferase